MALTPSNMMPLGTISPDFSALDVQSNTVKSLRELKSDKATLIFFICQHCPYVKHLNDALSQLAKDYKSDGLNCIAISSNNVKNYPEDSPVHLKNQADEFDFIFPYLYDETQEIAKSYDAACTPDFFLFDDEMKLSYRGQFDDSRPGNNKPVTGSDIRLAIEATLAGESVDENQIPSIGCNIKWK